MKNFVLNDRKRRTFKVTYGCTSTIEPLHRRCSEREGNNHVLSDPVRRLGPIWTSIPIWPVQVILISASMPGSCCSRPGRRAPQINWEQRVAAGVVQMLDEFEAAQEVCPVRRH